jgi:isopentenyl-diphosphate delta-isomerase
VNTLKPEYVVLVDEQDNELGTMEKLQAHREGKLHRAISVFVFNSEKKLLLQKRADGKYHSAGLWTNTCCSHPHPHENVQHAATRRLQEEMGMQCKLNHVFSFTYNAKFENNLSEHEFDHVFFGISDATPKSHPEEVSDWKYLGLAEIEGELKQNPEQFSAWFKLIFLRVKSEIEK